jgi:hypothetical protein
LHTGGSAIGAISTRSRPLHRPCQGFVQADDAELLSVSPYQPDFRRVDFPVDALLLILSDGSVLHEKQKSDRAGFRFHFATPALDQRIEGHLAKIMASPRAHRNSPWPSPSHPTTIW